MTSPQTLAPQTSAPLSPQGYMPPSLNTPSGANVRGHRICGATRSVFHTHFTGISVTRRSFCSLDWLVQEAVPLWTGKWRSLFYNRSGAGNQPFFDLMAIKGRYNRYIDNFLPEMQDLAGHAKLCRRHRRRRRSVTKFVPTQHPIILACVACVACIV